MHQRILVTASCLDLDTGLTTGSSLFSFMPPRLPPSAFVQYPNCRRELWRLPSSRAREGLSVLPFRVKETCEEKGQDRKANGVLRCESDRKEACTHRDLLAQEIHVFLTVAQTLLRGTELVGEKFFGFGDWVGEHDVGLVRKREREVSEDPFSGLVC
jgi:hypothetical protein